MHREQIVLMAAAVMRPVGLQCLPEPLEGVQLLLVHRAEGLDDLAGKGVDDRSQEILLDVIRNFQVVVVFRHLFLLLVAELLEYPAPRARCQGAVADASSFTTVRARSSEGRFAFCLNRFTDSWAAARASALRSASIRTSDRSRNVSACALRKSVPSTICTALRASASARSSSPARARIFASAPVTRRRLAPLHPRSRD